MKKLILYLKTKKTLVLLGMIMLINALSYGTIIPLLYPYATRFGLTATGLSLLFASFSLAQFLATPIIGRLADMYGRKPLLLGSLFGTSISLALFASATSIPMLFVARILDGITGGNISVAQAVIADKTSGASRAKAFGFLGASFGVGFLIGPAIGGLLSKVSLTAPFWFASGLALTGTIIGMIILEETLPKEHTTDFFSKPLFDWQGLFGALTHSPVRAIIWLTLFASIAQNAFIIGYQSFTNDVLLLTPAQIGMLFAIAGLVNIFSQSIGVPIALKFLKRKSTVIMYAGITSALMMFLIAFSPNVWVFIPLSIVFMVTSSPLFPLLSGIVSERTSAKEQGNTLGIQQSYQSIGQIGGPLLAGLVAALYIPGIFWITSFMYLVVFFLARRWREDH